MDHDPGKHHWWQRGLVYQVYPRSFMDSNGDGIGDLRGIEQRLDHLQWLGIDAVWLSPIFPSPMADFGYDVADYCAIAAEFGTMADFDRLLESAHRRGLKLILDLVPNHTSDRHPWFLDSRTSRTSAKRSWYLWHDAAAGGGPPNNWLSMFGGSAWEWDERTRQYYYHAFLKEQPDLNWRHPEVRAAMLEVMRWWLDKGVDGFRVDVMWHLIKDAQLRDNPRNPDWREGMAPYDSLLPAYSTDQPEVHEIVREMRHVMDDYDARVMIGEIYLPLQRLVTYYGEDGRGAHLPFNFQLVTLPWDARHIAAAIAEYEGHLPADGWPNWVLGNHDKPRIASRVGPAQARVAAILLLSLRGTPTMYYGDEIGMRDVPIAEELVQDPQEKNVPGLGLGRDPERTPMQWDPSPNAGFTQGAPWLPLAQDYATVNVAALREAADSLLVLYRRLIALRHAEPALSVGDYAPFDAQCDVLAFVRSAAGKRFLVALNLGCCVQQLELGGVRGRVVLSTHRACEGELASGTLELAGDHGHVIELEA